MSLIGLCNAKKAKYECTLSLSLPQHAKLHPPFSPDVTINSEIGLDAAPDLSSTIVTMKNAPTKANEPECLVHEKISQQSDQCVPSPFKFRTGSAGREIMRREVERFGDMLCQRNQKVAVAQCK